jgi:hypothetical protein
MDPMDEQPDAHAAARERRETKRRRGMQVTGRSTKSMLPDLIARRGREAKAWITRSRHPDPRIDEDEETE